MPFPNPWKPWFLYRPSQFARRVVRAVRPPSDPVRTVRLPWGVPLTIDTRETIGQSVWQTGLYDLAVTELLFRLTRPADLALDVGANIGAMTAALSAVAAEVWAFEPHPDVYARLAANVAGFPAAARCRPFRLAVGDADGEVGLECPDGFGGNNGLARVSAAGGLRVPAARLDTLLAGRPVGVMKMDVEGAEPAVLAGAADALTGGRVRDIVFEDHVGPAGPVTGTLRAAGYAVFGVGWRTAGLALVPPEDASVHKRYEAPSYLATREPDAAVAACRAGGWRCLRGAARG